MTETGVRRGGEGSKRGRPTIFVNEGGEKKGIRDLTGGVIFRTGNVPYCQLFFLTVVRTKRTPGLADSGGSRGERERRLGPSGGGPNNWVGEKGGKQ